MCATPTPSETTDKNGNTVSIENSSHFRVSISGRNNTIRIANTNATARVNIHIRGDGNIVDIGKCILKDFNLSIGSHQPVNGVELRIGNNFSIEPGGHFEIFTSFAKVTIGEQCMFSRNISLHFGDNPHLIFDKETGSYVDGTGEVTIGRKVWVGEGSYLSKRAVIADECIVAARSVVTRRFPDPNCVVGGNPARVVKEGVQWFRNRTSLPRPSSYAAAITAYDAEVEARKSGKLPVNPVAKAATADVGASTATSDATSAATWDGRWPEKTSLLLGIGAMKAGTSWLYDYLDTHPEVHFSPQKEVHYFDVMASKSELHHLNSKINMLSKRVAEINNASVQNISAGIRRVEAALAALQIYKNEAGTHEEYRSYLTKGHVSQKIIGDITPSYCTLPEERLAEMYALAPSVKIVFVMRDPIDRLWSAVRMRARQIDGNFEDLCRDLAEEIIQNGAHPMLTRSGYKDTIEKLQRIAPQKDLLFLFYETMFTQEVRDRICGFLGVSPHTGSDSKMVNAGRPANLPEDIREGFYALLEPEYAVVRTEFPTLVPNTWYRPTGT